MPASDIVIKGAREHNLRDVENLQMGVADMKDAIRRKTAGIDDLK